MKSIATHCRDRFWNFGRYLTRCQLEPAVFPVSISGIILVNQLAIASKPAAMYAALAVFCSWPLVAVMALLLRNPLN